MANMKMKFRIDDGAFAPERAHDTDAGIDLRSPVDVVVQARSSAIVRTGIHPQIKSPTDDIGAAGILFPRSGMNIFHDVLSFGVIDEGYSGEIAVKLYNLGDEEYKVHRGDKITQMVICDVRYVEPEIVDNIEAGERGDMGFGSTGR